MAYSLITFEIDDGVGLIRLNRPNDGNALIPELSRELLDAANRCDEDPEVRAVVLTGNGKMFCAGGDLKALPLSSPSVHPSFMDSNSHQHGSAPDAYRRG